MKLRTLKWKIMAKRNSVFTLEKNELLNIYGGGWISEAFWYCVGYWVGQQKRMADSPTGKLHPAM